MGAQPQLSGQQKPLWEDTIRVIYMSIWDMSDDWQEEDYFR